MASTLALLSNDIVLPLSCCICPQKPVFSDQSHLLTHIQSKGHLSHLYKSRLQAANDVSVRRDLDAYEDWYTRYNIQDLERERLNQKERRKSSNSAQRNDAIRRDSAARSSASTPLPPERLRSSHAQSVVDPRLTARVKMELFPPALTGVPPYPMPLHMGRQFIPPSQNCAMGSWYNSPVLKQESLDSQDDENEEYDNEGDDIDYFSVYHGQPFSHVRRHQHSNSNASRFADDCEIDATVTDSSQLKGVFWPGMGRFDSATPEMRRKRNQKKNASVVRQLQATSELVEADEWVFDATFSLRKKRFITGNPESGDDLIEGESSPEPERGIKKPSQRRRPRPALVDKDVNSGRLSRHRRGNTRRVPSSRTGGLATAKREEVNDDDLTYLPPRSKRRNGFSIHCDDSGPDITFDQPASSGLLNSTNYSLLSGTQSARDAALQRPLRVIDPNSASRTQHGNSSWAMLNSPFRPPMHQPWQNPVPQAYNFGQCISGPLGHASNFNLSAPNFPGQHMPAVYQVGSLVQQNASMRHPVQSTFNSMSSVNPSHSAGQENWNAFSTHLQNSLRAGSSEHCGLPAAGLSALNPLFLGDDRPSLEDDQVTISADGEH